jgi:hypothetical protein
MTNIIIYGAIPDSLIKIKFKEKVIKKKVKKKS